MFIHVTKDYAVALQEPQDFKKFKLVIDAPRADPARTGSALNGVATLDPEGHAWVSEEWLRKQDGAAAWQDGLTAMIGVAKKYSPPSIAISARCTAWSTAPASSVRMAGSMRSMPRASSGCGPSTSPAR
jgi:hypothetical protein